MVYGRLDGTMAFSERERQMTMFRESPDCMVFLLSTRAGSLGINLTSADTVIIYDSDWVGTWSNCIDLVGVGMVIHIVNLNPSIHS